MDPRIRSIYLDMLQGTDEIMLIDVMDEQWNTKWIPTAIHHQGVINDMIKMKAKYEQ